MCLRLGGECNPERYSCGCRSTGARVHATDDALSGRDYAAQLQPLIISFHEGFSGSTRLIT
jgi:hypothetical protein